MLEQASQLNPTQEMATIFNEMADIAHNFDMQQETPIQDLGKTKNSYFRSDDYLALYAENKQNKLWGMMTNSDQGKFPVIAGIFTEDMDPSFDTKGDAMPDGRIYGTRTKYIHSVGAVGKVKFIAEKDTPYSGVFKGADYGIVRLSSAAEPSKKQPLAPGLGLKLLRDGEDSANVVALFDLDGQPDDWNFFSHAFWNHIGGPDTIPAKTLAKKFADATPYIQEVSLKNFATADQKGAVENDVAYPFSIGFKPHDDVKDLFPKELQEGDYMSYMKQLPTVPADSTLYNIYAMDQPKELGGVETLIGTLQLDGSLKSSKWADENLYFRHERVSDDIQDHESWGPYEPKFGKGSWGCPFGYGSEQTE